MCVANLSGKSLRLLTASGLHPSRQIIQCQRPECFGEGWHQWPDGEQKPSGDDKCERAGSDIKNARALHEKAHNICVVANSMNFPVRYEPEVIFAGESVAAA